MSAYIAYRGDDGTFVQMPDGIRISDFSFTEQSEEGSVAMNTIPIVDRSVTTEISGHRAFVVEETAIPSGETGIFHGYTADREYSPLNGVSPTGRSIGLSVTDLNSVWGRRIMHGNDCNRPAETDVERMQWLMTTAESGLITDTTYLSTANPVHMDKCDYRWAMMDSVANDCAQASGKNWGLTFNFVDGDGYQVWYGKDELTTYDSGCTLTNDRTLVNDSTVFAISADTKINRDPGRVYSGVAVRWAKGVVYRQRTATATAFARRDVLIDAPFVKTKAAAIRRANRYLESFKEEDVTITTTIWVSAANANKVRPFHRVQFKSSMSAETASPIYARVMKRTITAYAVGIYQIDLVLNGMASASCDGGVQEALNAASAGGSLTFDWVTQPTVGQYAVSIIGTRNLHNSAHAPVAVTPATGVTVGGTGWTYEGYQEYSSGGSNNSSVEAASRIATSSDTTEFKWDSLDGSATPVGIALKFTGATDVTGPYSNGGANATTMAITGITITEPGVLVFLFQEHGFDQLPHNMTSPSGTGITLLVDGYARPGFPTSDWVSAGYQIITEAGTYDLTWVASNTYSDWQWQAIALFVPGAACPD